MKKTALALFLALETLLFLHLTGMSSIIATAIAIGIYFAGINFLDKPSDEVPVNDLEIYLRAAFSSTFISVIGTLCVYWRLGWPEIWTTDEVSQLLCFILLAALSIYAAYSFEKKRSKEYADYRIKHPLKK